MHCHVKPRARCGSSKTLPVQGWIQALIIYCLASRCSCVEAQQNGPVLPAYGSTSEGAAEIQGKNFAPPSHLQRPATVDDPRNASLFHSNIASGHDRPQDRGKFQHLTLATTINVRELKGLDEHGMRNAIEWKSITSFLHLLPAENVIVFADDRNDCPFLADVFGSINCRQVPCFHPKTNRPIVSCIFEEGERIALTEVFSFVNGDIILSTDFISVVEWATTFLPHFLLVGKRVDIQVTDLLSVPLDSLFGTRSITKKLRKVGEEHGEWGIDVFVYRVGDRPRRKFPPFVAGNWRWDNWLLSEFMSEAIVQVIDISKSVLILHQDKAQTQMMAKFRPASAYNNYLAHRSTGEKFQMGKITNSDIVLAEGCSLHDCTTFQNTEVEMDVLIHRRVSQDGYIVLLTVNSGYIDLFKNWLCWSRLFDFRNFMVLAEDGFSYNIALQEGCTAFLQHRAPRKRAAVEYGSKEFQDTMTFRTNAVLSVVTAGFHAVIADLDTIWLENPLPYFRPDCTLSGQTHKETSMSGGLVVVRGGPAGVRFWKQVIECQESNMEFIASHRLGTYDVSMYTEQECINRLGKGHAAKHADFSHCLLPPLSFPDGRRFFEQKAPQLQGLVPAIIHNNWIKGKDKKIERFKEWGLWMVDGDFFCKVDTLSNNKPEVAWRNHRVKIYLVDIGCLSCLEQSLTALHSGLFGRKPEVNVDLTVHVVDERTPLYVGAASNSSDRRKAVENFDWTHGTKMTVASVSYLEMLTKWSGEPMVRSDEGAGVVVVMDVASNLPQHLWQTLQVAVDGLVETRKQHPRLLGLSLYQPFVSEGLKSMDGWTGHQLVAPGAIILESEEWRGFQSWTARQLQLAEFSTCLPQLSYNQFLAAMPGMRHQWWLWMTLHSFQQGRYFALPPASTSGPRLNFMDTFEQFRNTTASALPVYDYLLNPIVVLSNLALRKNIFAHMDGGELCVFNGSVSGDVLQRLRLVA